MASRWRRTSGPRCQVPREETLRVDSMSIAFTPILVSGGWHITHVSSVTPSSPRRV